MVPMAFKAVAIWAAILLLAEKILERFEAGVYRYFVTEGCVFRVMV